MSYHQNFDHLGRLIDADQPWRFADLLRVAVAVGLVAGALVIWVA